MKITGNSTWRGPLLMTIAGLVAVGAVGPVYGWAQAIPIGAIALAAAIYGYLVARQDTDRGAMARGKLDERQQLLRWQAWSFSAHMTFAASAVGAIVAAVLRYPVWPFSVFIVYQVVAFYAGLARYSSRSAS
ncbi:MAG TPA: hypothetical protein VMB74_15995 [Streptosporangiaceae bacterium]|nr:hypothetical protein [Streptosporangiaceae bacterium]